MLDANGKRMLAYIQKVDSIEPINGADNIELAHVLGWTLIIKKGEFKAGDKCVFFEIDSKVPSDNSVYEFLAPKHYAVRTYKLNKFGVIGQGLILPLSSFPELNPELPLLTDLTDTLKVTYAIIERGKSSSTQSREQKEKNYIDKHKRFFNNFLIKQLMKNKKIRKLLLKPALSKKADSTKFPSQYISKSDEERVQNMPWILKDDKNTYTATEKIDGTSTTYLLVRRRFHKPEFYVCSRNLRLTEDDSRVYNGNDNIYWENAKKYHILETLKDILKRNKTMKWVCIQGESYGEGWQDNRLKIKGHNFAAFNLITSISGRLDSLSASVELKHYGIPWVPIIATGIKLTDFKDVDDILKYANGQSSINTSCLREGIVFRSENNNPISFKAVSPEYLMKHHI